MKKLFDSLSSVRSRMTYLASPLSYLFLTYWATVTTASARIALWDLFWHSGRSKVAGWQFWSPTELTVELFAVEYKTPLLSPYAAAVAASSIEHVFGVLILLGLFTPFLRGNSFGNDFGDSGIYLPRKLGATSVLDSVSAGAVEIWGRRFVLGSSLLSFHHRQF